MRRTRYNEASVTERKVEVPAAFSLMPWLDGRCTEFARCQLGGVFSSTRHLEPNN